MACAAHAVHIKRGCGHCLQERTILQFGMVAGNACADGAMNYSYPMTALQASHALLTAALLLPRERPPCLSLLAPPN
jgi:hypothetical protein